MFTQWVKKDHEFFVVTCDQRLILDGSMSIQYMYVPITMHAYHK